MEAMELTKGNCVSFLGEAYIIQECGEYITYLQVAGGGLQMAETSALMPLPISDEILKANGFVPDGDGGWQITDQIAVVSWNVGDLCYICDEQDIDDHISGIWYVHELQQGLRIMQTGICITKLKEEK